MINCQHARLVVDACDPPESCESDDVMADDADCGVYYVCDQNGEWTSTDCKGRLKCFHVELGQCGTCSDDGSECQEPCSPPPIVDACNPPESCEPDDVMADDTDCGWYYVCDQNGEWTRTKCSGQLKCFHVEIGQCRACGDGSECQEPCSPPDIADACNPPEWCIEGDVMADIDDCGIYYKCKNGRWLGANCGGQQPCFHVELGLCDTCGDGSECQQPCPPVTGTTTPRPDAAPCEQHKVDCIEGRMYPDRHHCNTYWTCTAGTLQGPTLCSPTSRVFYYERQDCFLNDGSIDCNNPCPTTTTVADKTVTTKYTSTAISTSVPTTQTEYIPTTTSSITTTQADTTTIEDTPTNSTTTTQADTTTIEDTTTDSITTTQADTTTIEDTTTDSITTTQADTTKKKKVPTATLR